MVESVDDLKSSCSVRGIRTPDFEVLDAKMASALNRISSRRPASRKRSVWRRWKLKTKTVSSEEDRSLTWSTSTSRSLEPMILSRIMRTYSPFFLEIDDIQEFDSKWDGILWTITKDSIWWHLGRFVQIKNTRVWETQDRIGIVQYGDSSEESWTWLSQIEDNGKEKYRAEFANEEFWGQKQKLWNKRRGQESKGKTAWTKKSRRLLAMES